MHSLELLQDLAAPFGLSPQDLTFVASSQNHVYRGQLASGKQVILRISEGRYRSRFEVLAELGWVSHLAGCGIPVCRPVPALDGEPCLASEVNGRECVVTCFEHAPGTRITREHLKPSLYKKLGTLLGSMHAESISYEVDAKAWARSHWYESRLICQDFEVFGSKLSPTFRSSVANLVSDLRTWPADSSTYGPIHGDVGFGNCHIHDDELWIFDFDNCELGYFIQDLATVLYDSIYCKVLNKFADDGLTDRMTPLWQAFLDGYAETGVVKSVNPEQMQKFFLLREAIIYGHYHRVLDVATLNESFKAGLEVMRRNVERQEHQVDFEKLIG